jgi:hypothetical protein
MRPERACRLLVLLGGLLLAALPGRALCAEPAPVRITSTPERLLLGTDASAELRIVTDPEATELRLFTSRGEVSAPVEEGPGRYRATFHPPRERYPQVALLVAVARGPRGALHGWSVLPLWGQGTAEVRTRPGAPVSLRVGEEVFGPLEADAQGVARVPVRVPPGVEHASFGTRRIALGVPPLPHVQAIAEQPVVTGDAAHEVTVRLYAVTPEGKPRREARFLLEATRGTVEGPQALAPGVSVVRWRLPPGAPGDVELRGGVPRDARSAFRVKLGVVPGPARRLSLQVDRETVTASEDARVTVTVRALDAVGNPAEVDLRLHSDFGEGPALRALGDGRYEGTLALPARFGGRESVELRVHSAGSQAPLLTHRLALRPAAPARVAVTALASRVIADGVSEAGYHVAVEDRFGNPVREAPVVLTASEPVGAPRPGAAPGTWELRYVPASVEEVHDARVEVRAGETIGRGGFLLEPRRFRAATLLRAGLVTDFGHLTARTAGVQVELRPEVPARFLGVALAADALTFSGLGEGAVGGFRGRNTYLSVSAALTAHLWLGRRMEVWGGVGPAVAWVHSRAGLGRGPALEEATHVWGAQGMVGVGHRLGPGLPFLEARALWFSDPNLHVLRGELRGVGLLVGYRLELF